MTLLQNDWAVELIGRCKPANDHDWYKTATGSSTDDEDERERVALRTVRRDTAEHLAEIEQFSYFVRKIPREKQNGTAYRKQNSIVMHRKQTNIRTPRNIVVNQDTLCKAIGSFYRLSFTWNRRSKRISLKSLAFSVLSVLEDAAMPLG